MAKDPAFLFYSADFYMGTIGMSAAQVGYYIRLMCLQHQQGHLSEALIKTVMPRLDPVVMAKFIQDDEGLWYNARLARETEKRNDYVSSRRKNARSKTNPKDTPASSETKHMDEHMGEHMPAQAEQHMHEHMPEHMENENENENRDINTRVTKGGVGGNKKRPPPRHRYGEYQNVLLSEMDMAKLRNEFPDWEQRIERLSGYMASSGKAYKDHLATIRNWARKDGQHGRADTGQAADDGTDRRTGTVTLDNGITVTRL